MVARLRVRRKGGATGVTGLEEGSNIQRSHTESLGWDQDLVPFLILGTVRSCEREKQQ
jgi:hypothetical protein